MRDVRLRQPRMGARKLHHLLKEPLQQAHASLGCDALLDVLREARLLVAPRRVYHKTTDSHHRFRRHPNLLKEGPHQMHPTGSEQVWVADITYLPTDREIRLPQRGRARSWVITCTTACTPNRSAAH